MYCKRGCTGYANADVQRSHLAIQDRWKHIVFQDRGCGTHTWIVLWLRYYLLQIWKEQPEFEQKYLKKMHNQYQDAIKMNLLIQYRPWEGNICQTPCALHHGDYSLSKYIHERANIGNRLWTSPFAAVFSKGRNNHRKLWFCLSAVITRRHNWRHATCHRRHSDMHLPAVVNCHENNRQMQNMRIKICGFRWFQPPGFLNQFEF